MEVNAFNAQQGRDEFLQLLVTQMQHQDPLDPIKQHDFLSQLAQFSTLEGIEKLNGSFQQQLSMQEDVLHLQQVSQASALVGHEASYREPGSEALRTGTIEAVRITEGRLQVDVGGISVTLDRLAEVRGRVSEPISAGDLTSPEVPGDTSNPIDSDSEAAATTSSPSPLPSLPHLRQLLTGGKFARYPGLVSRFTAERGDAVAPDLEVQSTSRLREQLSGKPDQRRLVAEPAKK